MLIVLAGRRGVASRWRLLALAGATLALLLTGFSGGRGRVFLNEPQCLAALQDAGFVRVGRFGRAQWPAVVVDRADGDGGVSFVDASGQAHDYRGFKGPMRALRLKPLRPDGRGHTPTDFVQVFGVRAAPRTPLE